MSFEVLVPRGKVLDSPSLDVIRDLDMDRISEVPDVYVVLFHGEDMGLIGFFRAFEIDQLLANGKLTINQRGKYVVSGVWESGNMILGGSIGTCNLTEAALVALQDDMGLYKKSVEEALKRLNFGASSEIMVDGQLLSSMVMEEALKVPAEGDSETSANKAAGDALMEGIRRIVRKDYFNGLECVNLAKSTEIV